VEQAAAGEVRCLGQTQPAGTASSQANWERSLMPLYHFKLVDTHIVGDHGFHHLADETAAQIEAIKLARSLRVARPELVEMNCSISVTDEEGSGICIIPLEIT
jgi:hypothetical protein